MLRPGWRPGRALDAGRAPREDRSMTGRVLPLALALFAAALPAAGADIRDGARVFRACAACHSLQPGVHLTGPSLARVWGRKAGTAAGFERYSNALARSGITWDRQSLDKWLANPEALVPGNAMNFPGIANASARADLVAYLKAVSEGKASAPRADARPDLKSAPPEGRVTAIGHCGDTYTIETADGQTSRIWEYNLRLKTDSSPRGPSPGKPVVLGAGMRGDRASVVFASPAEISRAIRETCR